MIHLEMLLYTAILALGSCAWLISCVLVRLYKLKALVSYQRFFNLLSLWMVLDLSCVYYERYIVPVSVISAFKPVIFFVVNCLECVMIYRIPHFVLTLTSPEEPGKRLRFFRNVSHFFLCGVVVRIPFLMLDRLPETIEMVFFLILNATFLSVVLWVTYHCFLYIKNPLDEMTYRIARWIVILISFSFFGFLFDFSREGFLLDFLGASGVRVYLEWTLSLHFYTLFYGVWSAVFLHNSLDLLIHKSPEAQGVLTKESLIHHHITAREQEVIYCIFEGKSNREISEELFISEKTVKRHLQNIYEKLQVNNRMSMLKTLHISALNSLEK